MNRGKNNIDQYIVCICIVEDYIKILSRLISSFPRFWPSEKKRLTGNNRSEMKNNTDKCCVTYWSHQDRICSIALGVELVRHTWVSGIHSWYCGIELSRWSAVSFAPKRHKNKNKYTLYYDYFEISSSRRRTRRPWANFSEFSSHKFPAVLLHLYICFPRGKSRGKSRSKIQLKKKRR